MLFCIFYYKENIREESKDISLYNLMFMGLVFQTFTPIIGEFFRISMYFSILNIALIPNTLIMEKIRRDL